MKLPDRLFQPDRLRKAPPVRRGGGVCEGVDEAADLCRALCGAAVICFMGHACRRIFCKNI